MDWLKLTRNMSKRINIFSTLVKLPKDKTIRWKRPDFGFNPKEEVIA